MPFTARASRTRQHTPPPRLPDGAVTQGAAVGQLDALAIGGVASRRAVLRVSRRGADRDRSLEKSGRYDLHNLS
jgi:hypothetical protein